MQNLRHLLYQKSVFFKYGFFIWLLILTILSVTPNIPTQEIIIDKKSIRIDYLLHFASYFILAALFAFWKLPVLNQISVSMFLIFLSVGILFGVLHEFVQKWVPGRAYNPFDIISNVSGMIVCVFIFFFGFKRSGSH